MIENIYFGEISKKLFKIEEFVFIFEVYLENLKSFLNLYFGFILFIKVVEEY